MSELNEINTHIEELRKRVVRSIISILVSTVFILTFHATPFDVMGVTLYYPYPEPLDNIAAQFTNVMRGCLLYTSPSPRDLSTSRMPSCA